MSYYDDLGISQTATKEEITSAYRKIQKQYHPDVYKGSDTEYASEKVKLANAAYDVLGDEYKRSEYDRNLKAGAFDSASNPYANTSNTNSNPYSGFYYNPYANQYNNPNNKAKNPFDDTSFHYRRTLKIGSLGRIALRLVVWYMLFRFISTFARVGIPFFFFF